jgi:hypothetical protein
VVIGSRLSSTTCSARSRASSTSCAS